MPRNRVIYQNWIAEMGLDPTQIKKFFDIVSEDIKPDVQTDGEVRRAIESLAEDEMEFVIRFYFMGQGYQDIADKSGRVVHKLEALHKRAIRKLKSRLQSFVKKRYGVKSRNVRSCPVCESPRRAAIDELIINRNELATWRPVLKEINEKFGLNIKSP